MRLSAETADRLPAAVARGDYDRQEQRAGIVHLGIGAFHRAHQATYTDLAMAAGDRDWAITGVSLRSQQVRDQLAPQSCLYTVTERQARGPAIRLVQAVTDVIVAPDAPERVSAALASPETRIVTLTVTEKGYAQDAKAGAPVAGANPRSIYDYLAQAVIARHDAGLAPLTLISCDNLSNNGGVLRQRLGEHLDTLSPSHRRWFEQTWACPATMVDRIVPATTATDLDSAESMLRLRDEGAVITEPYSQWVIEDRFAGDRPRWDLVGAAFVDDVVPFETAKLRMLNGAHSALAYLGLARGHAYVHEAIADPAIGPLIGRLMRDEAAPTIRTSPGQDLNRYADVLLARFRNPALPHRLIQIAADGSQKIGARWLVTVADNRAAGRSSPTIFRAIAAWVLFVRGDRQAVDDPNAKMMAQTWTRANPDGVVNELLGPSGMFGEGLALSRDERVEVRNLLP